MITLSRSGCIFKTSAAVTYTVPGFQFLKKKFGKTISLKKIWKFFSWLCLLPRIKFEFRTGISNLFWQKSVFKGRGGLQLDIFFKLKRAIWVENILRTAKNVNEKMDPIITGILVYSRLSSYTVTKWMRKGTALIGHLSWRYLLKDWGTFNIECTFGPCLWC